MREVHPVGYLHVLLTYANGLFDDQQYRRALVGGVGDSVGGHH